LYLDNGPHFQSSWVTQGLRVGQLALEVRCDATAAIMIAATVARAAGAAFRPDTPRMVAANPPTGRRAAQRDTPSPAARRASAPAPRLAAPRLVAGHGRPGPPRPPSRPHAGRRRPPHGVRGPVLRRPDRRPGPPLRPAAAPPHARPDGGGGGRGVAGRAARRR